MKKQLFCQCGCGKPIPWMPHHSWKPSKYIRAHAMRWKKGKGKIWRVNERGYIQYILRDKNQWKYQHVLVMEAHIGRRIRHNEVVHHINENKRDNRIENLQLMTRGEHIVYHVKKKPRSYWQKVHAHRKRNELGRYISD